MSDPNVIAGAGPAGMAAALALRIAGHEVVVYERGAAARQQGGGVNLWAPAVKALHAMGVDTEDLLTSCPPEFRSHKDRKRALVKFDHSEEFHKSGGFIFATPRPELYERMLSMLPAGTVVTEKGVESYVDRGKAVDVELSDGTTVKTPLLVGADGIHSRVRRQLVEHTEIRDHRLLVLLGFTEHYPADLDREQFILRHSRTVQASWAGMLRNGKPGVAWYFVEKWDPAREVPSGEDFRQHCLDLARDFPPEIADFVSTSDPDSFLPWRIRDLGVPPEHWSAGRVVIAGDAAHATSPYAAYGAGMSIVDGYFLGQALAGVHLDELSEVRAALEEYERHRVEHTRFQVELAYTLGKLFHHSNPIARRLRDFVLDHTSTLQKQVGDDSPAQIANQLEEMGNGILEPASSAPS